MKLASATLALAALLGGSVYAADPPVVPFPTGYRSWAHVKSMTIQQGHPLFDSFGGIHHIYANPKALEGYRKGGAFQNGSIIVFDLLDAKASPGAIEEGPRKVLGVMVKDSSKWKATGGWGFEAFKADSRTERAVGDKAAEACFNCHAPQVKQDYTFSRWRE